MGFGVESDLPSSDVLGIRPGWWGDSQEHQLGELSGHNPEP